MPSFVPLLVLLFVEQFFANPQTSHSNKYGVSKIFLFDADLTKDQQFSHFQPNFFNRSFEFDITLRDKIEVLSFIITLFKSEISNDVTGVSMTEPKEFNKFNESSGASFSKNLLSEIDVVLVAVLVNVEFNLL